MQEATEAPCSSFVLPHHPSFFAPQDAPAAIRTFCRETGQAVPESRGEISRCILESLALAYGSVADSLAQLTGRSLAHLHVVGGGSRNHLLNQLTANALNIPVHAGPAEATATGNVLLQAMAREDVGSLEELRDIVRRSSEVVDFLPAETARWTAKRQVYLDLAANP
jgi:rhamnulokinase